MLYAALCALLGGATAGVFLASRHFLRKRLPVWVALLHGLGGAIGFTLVLLVVVQEPSFELARQALYLFCVTIALGCVNLLFHVRRVRHRTSLILMHALAALSGVGTLVFALFAERAPAFPSSIPPAPPAPRASATGRPLASAVPALPAPPAALAPLVPAAAGAAPARASLAEDVREVFAERIGFESGSAELHPASLPAIDAIARTLETHPEIDLLQVQGHADRRGEDSTNLELTRRRAARVVSALVERGVSHERLHGAGYGDRCPVDERCDPGADDPLCLAPAALARDRRVVFLPLRVRGERFQGEVACARAEALIPAEDREFHVAATKR